MSAWQDWPLSEEWSDEGYCPDCGHSLIITDLINAMTSTYYYDSKEYIYNGICPDCHKQYTIASTTSLPVNEKELEQQDRISALEERVARLEALVQKLLDTPRVPTNPPAQPPENDAQEGEQDATLRARYKFLF